MRELGRRSVTEMIESTHIIIFICRFCIKHYGWFYKSPPLVLPNIRQLKSLMPAEYKCLHGNLCLFVLKHVLDL